MNSNESINLSNICSEAKIDFDNSSSASTSLCNDLQADNSKQQKIETDEPILTTNLSTQITNDPSSTTNNTEAQSKSNQNMIDFYLKALNHAVTCIDSGCRVDKCVQMKRIINHSKNCPELKSTASQPSNPRCDYCRQLIALCIYHAKSCQEDVCQVPYCESIKIKLNKMQEFKVKLESITEFIMSNLKLLKYKIKIDSQTQTSSIDNEPEISQNNLAIQIDQDEMEKNRLLYIEKLEKIKSDITVTNTCVLSSREERLFKFDKKIRQQLCKNLIDLLVNNFDLKLKNFFQNLNFASLIAYFLKCEKDLFTKTQNSDDYLFLLTELFFKTENEFKKKLCCNNNHIETQTEYQLDYEAQLNENDCDNDLYIPPRKRVKFE